MTPYELGLINKAHGQLQKEEHELRGWLAWNTAALHRSKRLPPLKSFIGHKEDPKKVGKDLKAVMKAVFPTKKKGMR